MADGADAVAQLDVDKADGLLDDAAGDDVADLVLGDIFVNLGGDELLHAELDLALFGVDGEDLCFDDLALAQHFRGVVKAAFGGDLADVDQAFDAVGELDEGSEVHQLGDGAGDLRADGEGANGVGPGVGEGLLEAEGDASLLWLDAEDDDIDAGALFEQVGGVAELFAVGHF